MPRIGTGVRASLPAAVRFERNGWRLQKLSSGNVTAGENLAETGDALAMMREWISVTKGKD